VIFRLEVSPSIPINILPPPMAQSNPNVDEICINNFLFAGIFIDNIPMSAMGAPKNIGIIAVGLPVELRKYAVIPQAERISPAAIEICGMFLPATVYALSDIIRRPCWIVLKATELFTQI